MLRIPRDTATGRLRLLDDLASGTSRAKAMHITTFRPARLWAFLDALRIQKMLAYFERAAASRKSLKCS